MYGGDDTRPDFALRVLVALERRLEVGVRVLLQAQELAKRWRHVERLVLGVDRVSLIDPWRDWHVPGCASGKIRGGTRKSESGAVPSREK